MPTCRGTSALSSFSPNPEREERVWLGLKGRLRLQSPIQSAPPPRPPLLSSSGTARHLPPGGQHSRLQTSAKDELTPAFSLLAQSLEAEPGREQVASWKVLLEG